MKDIVSVHVIGAVWSSLLNGPTNHQLNALPVFADRYRNAEYVPSYVLDDLLWDIGLGAIASAEGLRFFDVEIESLFTRPSGRAQMSMGGTFVRLTEVAAFLIKLEQLGLDVDPAPLVFTLRPALAKKARLTAAEIAIWWFEKERHRSEPVCLMIANVVKETTAEEMLTTTGYKAEVWKDDSGRPVTLFVRAPRYRRRRAA